MLGGVLETMYIVHYAQGCQRQDPPFPLMRGQTRFGHIPSIEQNKRDVFITVIKNSFTIFYGFLRNVKL